MAIPDKSITIDGTTAIIHHILPSGMTVSTQSALNNIITFLPKSNFAHMFPTETNFSAVRCFSVEYLDADDTEYKDREETIFVFKIHQPTGVDTFVPISHVFIGGYLYNIRILGIETIVQFKNPIIP